MKVRTTTVTETTPPCQPKAKARTEVVPEEKGKAKGKAKEANPKAKAKGKVVEDQTVRLEVKAQEFASTSQKGLALEARIAPTLTKPKPTLLQQKVKPKQSPRLSRKPKQPLPSPYLQFSGPFSLQLQF